MKFDKLLARGLLAAAVGLGIGSKIAYDNHEKNGPASQTTLSEADKIFDEKVKYLSGLLGGYAQIGRQKISLEERQRTAADAQGEPTIQDIEKIIETTHLDEKVETGLATPNKKISRELLIKLIAISFPKSWTTQEVHRITAEPLDDRNGGVAYAEFDRIKHKITFFNDAVVDSNNPYSFAIGSLAHEFGHAYDWVSDGKLTDSERVDFLFAAVERVQAPDRWKSAYVESIEFIDPKEQLSHRVTEYWAEIVNQYITNPKALAQKDFILVDKYVKLADPDFDPFERQKRRKTLVASELLKFDPNN